MVACETGACSYQCEPGWADVDEDWILDGEPYSDSNGCEVPCTVSEDGLEVCDNEDNDCNGIVDDVDPAGADASVPVWFRDGDGDGEGTRTPGPGDVRYACDQPDGFVASNTDCDDDDATVNSAADEVCDGIDRNCDGVVDGPDAVDATTWYPDSDGDSFGAMADTTTPIVQCDQPQGFVDDGSDCNDQDASLYQIWQVYFDVDGDTYRTERTAVCGGDTIPDKASLTPSDEVDCDDDLAEVNPGEAERCDGRDTDCDGDVDRPVPTDAPTWYVDCDGDGFGVDTSSATQQCEAPAADEGCENPAAGWTTTVPTGSDVDCVPEDERAFPGQSAFFGEPIADDDAPFGDLYVGDTIQQALLVWDFNCDHQYTRQVEAHDASCTAVGPECSGTQGWTGSSAPGCGGEAEFQNCYVQGTVIQQCNADVYTRTQGCR